MVARSERKVPGGKRFVRLQRGIRVELKTIEDCLCLPGRTPVCSIFRTTSARFTV